jgi:hypothetical protein
MLSVALWKLTSEIYDHLDRGEVKALQDIAQELDDYTDDRERSEQQQEENDLRRG